MRAMEERYKMYLEKARNVSDENVPLFFFWFFKNTKLRPVWSDLYSLLFLLVGDPCAGSKAKSSHRWDPSSEEPVSRSGQADSQPGGKSAFFLIAPSVSECFQTSLIFGRFVSVASMWASQTERVWGETNRHSMVQQGKMKSLQIYILPFMKPSIYYKSVFLHLQSLNFQKLAIESRLGGCTSSMVSPAQSFLSQQRQVSNAPRRALSISVPATTSK